MPDHFNLVDESWVPVADAGRVSLREVFSNPELRMLGGNPIQKIALMKLLQAICQATATPADDAEWRAIGWQGMAERCLAYLDQWRDRFDLFGERPFLQLPTIAAADKQAYGAVMPEVATGNTTRLFQSQVERRLEDADKALLLVTLMGFALGGKRTDNRIVLTPGYSGKKTEKGKPSTGKPGPWMAHMGLLHSFWQGETLLQGLWCNLLTAADIAQCSYYTGGLGVAPWEEMPQGEDCAVAQRLKNTLMGRLVPLNRFCLLADDGLHYSEGIIHPSHKSGGVDPTVAINFSGKEPKALWTNPEKRPWRELTSLLGFIQQGDTSGFNIMQLRSSLDRIRDAVDRFAVWSGGLRFSISSFGDQFATGSDDFVESLVWLESGYMGEIWFAQVKLELKAMEEVAKALYGCVIGYYREQKADRNGQGIAAHATHLYWAQCERDFQSLIDNCDATEQSKQKRQQLRRQFAACAHQAFDQCCPRETARQMDAWAKCRPNYSQYLKQEDL